ncbi:MAG TPA: PAS domain S-box protein [Candidatus Limnocylindrales bacterium]
MLGKDLQLLEQLEAGLVVVDPSGLVVHWNDRAERLLGRAADQAVGRRWQDCVVLVRGAVATPRRIRAAFGQPGGWNGVLRARVAPGLVLTFQAHVQPVSLGDGPDQGTMAFFWPIPESASVAVAVALQTREAQMLRDLAGLPAVTNAPAQVQPIAEHALKVISDGWSTDMSVLFIDDSSGGGLVVAGPNTSEAARARLAGMGSANARLTGRTMEVAAAVQFDLSGESPAPAIAERVRALGCQTLRATPISFGGKSIGALVLLWTASPDSPFDADFLEMVGDLVGTAVGSADLRIKMGRESDLRARIEGSARIGGVVLAQMTEAILTTDKNGSITTVNPAAEHQYGFRAEDVVGLPLRTVVEQLRLDGTPIGKVDQGARDAGHWHDRAIHRPLVGSKAGQNVVVDLSLTAMTDERHRPAGLIALSHELTAAAHLESEAAALSSLAVATGRARTRQEVAEVAIERLCEATMADVGLIVSWPGHGRQMVEAVRGLGEEMLQAIRDAQVPQLPTAIEEPGRILAIEGLPDLMPGSDVAALLARETLSAGFVVALRSRDESRGFLALASRHATWARPSDEVILQAAAQVSNALENALLLERFEQGLEQEQRLTAQLESLMGLTQLPQGEITEAALARFLLKRVIAALGAQGGFAVRVEGNQLEVLASFGTPTKMIRLARSQPADSFYFWQRLKASGGAAAFHLPLTEVAHEGAKTEQMTDRGISSYAVFPIRDGDKVLGALLCHFGEATEGRAQIDDRAVEAVGRIVSIAYANLRMSEGLAEAADHERRLTAELRALQGLTLLGASTDDLGRLAHETIEAVVVATGASGGGYMLVDPSAAKVDPVVWVGHASSAWIGLSESPTIPSYWPPVEQLQSDDGIWLSHPDDADVPDDGRPMAQAVLPLRVDDRLAGALHLEWTDLPRREQFDVHFLEPIARICSISLANFRLRSELLHRASAQRALGHRLDTLDELTRIGEEASSFEELAHRTVSLVREALSATGVCYLLIEAGHHFETHAVAGETGAFRLWLRGVPARDTPGGSLLLSGGGSVLGDFVAGQVNERVLPLARATDFRSFGAIPIRTGEELAGALMCFFEQPAGALPIDEAALDSVARIAGIALANFRLRERLVSSEERYRTLFEESPDALLVTALDGTVLDTNEAMIRLYRVNRGEVLGRYFGQLISADEREMARRRQIVWAQGRGTFLDRGRRPDGSEFPVEVEIRVVELGGQRRFLSLVRDLSDQERLQRELLQAQKMEALGQLVSGVAHELNNPLAAIIAFSQLLRGDERLPDDMKHDAGLLVQEADRTRRIVQNLLDFARQRPPERRPTSIATLVQSVLELQSYALGTNRIQVSVDIPESLPEVDLDRAQLQQVLLNLTINAIQAIRSRERGQPAHIWITAALVRARAASSATTRGERPAEDQRRFRLAIRDDGPGVPEAARARLFDPFFTTKQPGEGTGLGLSVSFGIVAAHGGHLWYEPGPDELGSSFIIELPVRAKMTDERRVAEVLGVTVPLVTPAEDNRETATPAHVPAAAKNRSHPATPGNPPATAAAAPAAVAATTPTPSHEPDPPMPPAAEARARDSVATNSAAAVKPATATGAPERSTSRPRILALDDEPSIRAFLRKVLAAAGMDCTPAQDGAQALDGLRDTTYDVMLIDHRMAGMSGTEFYEAAVNFRPELANRAVFMSGDVLNPDLREFATQRGIRLLAKPFDIDAVIRIVHEVLASAAEADAKAEAKAEAKPGA